MSGSDCAHFPQRTFCYLESFLFWEDCELKCNIYSMYQTCSYEIWERKKRVTEWKGKNGKR